ncbi:MAG: hypothetical protein QNK23_15400 [Crocinitomicaceae bacterium]|nr:hypothetical protein [Crocinitomicaceae bacterium]
MEIAAGILLVLISIVHNIYGEKKQIPALKELTKDSITIGSQRIMIFQGGVLLFAVGIIQILSSLDIIALTGVARYFPVGIVLINVCTSLFIILISHKEVLKITIPQFVIFGVIISLQLLSLKCA